MVSHEDDQKAATGQHSASESISSKPKTFVVASGGGAMSVFFWGVHLGLRASLGEHYACGFVGTSGGALFATAAAQGGVSHWTNLFESLTPRQIFRRRPTFSGLRFASTRTSKPLRRLIEENVDVQKLRALHESKKRQCFITCTNLKLGSPFTATPDQENFKDFLYASASFPLVFRPVMINNILYVDGGVTQNTPISTAIKAGADRIIVMTARPDIEDDKELSLNRVPPMLTTAKLVVSALVQSQIRSDLKLMTVINDYLRGLNSDQPNPNGHRLLPDPFIIAPTSRMKTFDFSRDSIRAMLRSGRELGMKSADAIREKFFDS